MQFNRLRTVGFKSFVDPVEFSIEPGLTGVVGPNGCGKSNLVEAVRWVMGEHSAKRMRGSGMDDVIFNGTGVRPARNIAEVVLSLDNSDRTAPALFNHSDELEVSRHIERESGSIYRVNGREVRARDVQLLFADAATGAHSPALVSQGEIGAIIQAKPLDRRAILEEAAGISGLHSRRHEAELRLRAAETNLGRLGDVMAVLESQLQGLKRQVRQATRYRNLSGHIRRAEAILFHHAWCDASAALDEARRRFNAAEAEVVERTREAAAASAAQLKAADALGGLRQNEAEAAARLSRLAAASEALDAEEERLNDDRRRLEGLLAQIADDLGREEVRLADADEALARLDDERAALDTAGRDDDSCHDETEQQLAVETAAVLDLDQQFQGLTTRVAAAEARRVSLTRQQEEGAARRARTQDRRQAIADERDRLQKEAAPSGGKTAAIPFADEQEAARRARKAWAAAEQDRAGAERAAAEAREPLPDLEAPVAALRAEHEALVRLLGETTADRPPPLAEQVVIEDGYEAAVGAALGDDLEASAEASAPAHWRQLSAPAAAPALPDGAVPLSRFVTAPGVLAPRLAQVGVIEEDDGASLQEMLAQGQRLVSRAGTLWRWDGLTVTAGITTRASKLAQRNRLRHVQDEIAELEAPLTAARQHLAEAAAAAAAAARFEAAAREASRAADDKLAEEREKHTEAREANAARVSRLAALAEAASDLEEALGEAEAQSEAAEVALRALPPTEGARREVAKARTALETRRAALADAQRAVDQRQARLERRAGRLATIESERQSWEARVANTRDQLAQLSARHDEVEAERAALADRPAEIAERRRTLLSHMGEAEAARTAAADALAAAENEFAARDRAARSAQASQGAAREERVRCEAQAAQAEDRRAEVAARIQAELACAPDEALAAADLKDGAPIPEAGPTEVRLERLKRERDNMGPVNLRAEAEAAEIDEKLQTMRDERADLEAAIDRLRQGIARLNREGRERIKAAFTEVDEHFRKLFTRLFGGGRAHLALTESDDPLEAGLEIMASPPGKRLQSMSLLSGGEQALTAISLLFAVFLTHPAPICVLDEVDAPLDDANVELFLSLITDIAQQCGTRFLVVTHNPITMGRMDRLYGITMSERGVSQIVSVDLVEAEALRAAE